MRMMCKYIYRVLFDNSGLNHSPWWWPASIFKWFEEDKLLINISKSQAIHLHHVHHKHTVDIPLLSINNASIPYSSKVKNLDFIINSRFDCKSHINATVQKICHILSKLWYIASFLQPDLKFLLLLFIYFNCTNKT